MCVYTSDKQETGLELLQENDTFTLEATSQQDKDGAGGDGSLELGGLVVGLAGRKGLLHVIGSIPTGSLYDNRGLGFSLGGGLLDDKVSLLVRAGLRAAKGVDALS